MDKKILLQDLAEAVASRKKISKKDADNFVRNVFGIIEDNLKIDGVVKIKGLGTFKVVKVESRESINVNTGERIRINGHSKVTFTPDAVLRDQINKPFAEFETVVINDGTDIEEMERVSMPLEPIVEEAKEEEEVAVMEETTIQVDETPIEDAPQENETPIEEKVEETIVEDKPEEPVEEEKTEEEPKAEEKPVVEEKSEEEPVAEEEPVVDEKVEEEPVEAPKPAEEPEPVVAAQHVATQTVEELNVTKQHVEQQIIQQISTPSENTVARGGIVLSRFGIVALVVFMLLLMIGSYYLGHLHIINFDKLEKVEVKKESKDPDNVPEKPVSKKIEKPATPVNKVPAQPAAEELAKNYEQLEGGEYLIVGTKETHVMTSGDGLYRIAQKTYGDKNLAKYIIFYNKITNPDLVKIGKEIKLPELVKKE